MSSMMVSRLVLPVAIGGHPGLDFCNTRAGWGASAPKEYLLSYDHLAVWARESGVFRTSQVAALRRTARSDPAAAQEVLTAALALREAAYAVLLGSRAAADFAVVAANARAARAASTLRRSTRGGVPLARWVLPAECVNAPLLGVAAQLDELLSSSLSCVVAACPGVGCGWLFADPRQRRRWCDMAVCGNRAKARRHAERLAASRYANEVQGAKSCVSGVV